MYSSQGLKYKSQPSDDLIFPKEKGEDIRRLGWRALQTTRNAWGYSGKVGIRDLINHKFSDKANLESNRCEISNSN